MSFPILLWSHFICYRMFFYENFFVLCFPMSSIILMSIWQNLTHRSTKIDFWTHFSWFSVPSAHPPRASKIEFYLKLRVFNIFLRFFFFSSDSWDVAFFKNEKGGSKGGSPEAVFWFEKSWFFENFKKKSKLLTKIQPQVIPLLIPLFHFWKKQHLSFHWKKNRKKILKTKDFTLKSVRTSKNGWKRGQSWADARFIPIGNRCFSS